PGREADWRRTLSQLLHVRATVEQIVSPRPGVVRLKNVRLADLRSGRPLCALGEIRAQWRGPQLTLVADELRVEAESFSTLATTLATWLSATELPAVDLQARRLTIVGSSQQTLSLLHVRVQSERPTAQTQQLALQAILPAAERGGATHTLRLVVRQHEKLTTATLDTDTARLPSWLLADLLPSFARCAGAKFTGSVRLEGNAQEVSGSLQGRLEYLTINDWLGPDSPHRVRGIAHVELEQLTWRGDRVVTAHGNLYAANGAIGHSLLLDVIKRFYCVPGPLVELKTNSVEKMQSFDELACEFHITSEGITLTGKCASLADSAPGCMLTIDGRPLLMEPTYANLPVAQLVQVLSQPASSWLPASQEAHAMAGKLPLPSVGSQTPKEVATRPDRNAHSLK
ncbi:MAG: hypothetical protein IH898_13715, partial [Planctomycetes bacterium]|nr:hypothetical protein [Planctomycetota bacterium]